VVRRLLDDVRIDGKYFDALGGAQNRSNPRSFETVGGPVPAARRARIWSNRVAGGHEQQRVTGADRMRLQGLQVSLLTALLFEMVSNVSMTADQFAQGGAPMLHADQRGRTLQCDRALRLCRVSWADIGFCYPGAQRAATQGLARRAQGRVSL
jgi:hypothetical protein